jgi:tRNA threonylcarbamoyladenosine biosynthesis protein TsaB
MILAMDTSTRTVGIALYDGEQVRCEITWLSRDHHTVELAPAVVELLAKAGVKIGELQAVAVATGPGSFTGLRIGLALAKGLALANRLALVGVPTLDILAAAQPVADLPMAAVLRAGRGRLALGWYQSESGAWKLSKPVEVTNAHDLFMAIQSPTLVCGELSDEERRLLGRKRKNIRLATPAQSLRRPGFLAELGWRRWQAGQVDDPATLAPFYLHFNDLVPG